MSHMGFFIEKQVSDVMCMFPIKNIDINCVSNHFMKYLFLFFNFV